MKLILASTSPYRRQLLERLRLPFDCKSPETDETSLMDELPTDLAKRLALQKAEAVAATDTDAWVIGSDQVAAFADKKLGKPGNFENAYAQLRQMSGQAVYFYTAIAVINKASGECYQSIDTTQVVFRSLIDDEIARYLQLETPYDCAGSFKSEGLGISLFESIKSDDPTALIGLPLIQTARLLRIAGFQLP